MVILAIITMMAVFAPMLSPYPFDKVNYDLVSCSPDWWPDKMVLCNAGGAHWFGTDALGRDLFVRVLYGARVSLAVGMAATLVSLVIGVAYGAVAGFFGGRRRRTDDALCRCPLFAALHLSRDHSDGRVQPQIFLLFVAIGAVEWLTMARIVRGQTLSIKQKEYVEAARAAGVGQFAHHPAAHHPECVRAR